MTESEFQEFIITIGYRYCEKAKTAFNSFEGFHTTILFNKKENRYIFSLNSDTETQTSVEDIQKKLKELHKNNIVKSVYSDKKIIIVLKMSIDSDIDKNNLKQTANFMINLCKSGKMIPICESCSQKNNTGIYIVGSKLTPLCGACVEKKRRQYEHRKNVFELKKQNMPAGIIGAIFGALFGASIYMLLYQLIPMFGTASVFIAVLSFMGFVITGERATKKSAVICILISLAIFIITEYLSIVVNMAILIERQGGGIAVSEAINAVGMSLSDNDFFTSVLIDTAIGIMTIIAAGFIYFLKRKYTRPLKISENLL